MPDPVSATVAAVSSVGSAAIQSRGAKKAASAQTQSERERLALEERMFERNIALQEPFRQVGLENLNKLSALYSPETGAYFKAPTMEELAMDPGYSFRLSEGEKALARMQAARGQFLGGGAIKAGTRYSQEMGSQEFQNAYARAMQQRQMGTSVLAQLAGLGPSTTSQMVQTGQQYTTGAGQAMSNIGAARASGYMGQANALAQALGQGAGFYGLYKGGYFGPSNVKPGGGANLNTMNYMGPQYGGYG